VSALSGVSDTAADHERLRQALTLAEDAIGLSEPNPRVGCVIADDRGRTLGVGATREAGGPHAEVVALQAARAAGHLLRGATAWVTLEPCAHHGRTPPCCDALIDAGLARVVVAIGDPFPQVAGRGIERLRAAGVRVDLAADLGLPDVERAARELNLGFFSRVQRGRPWLRMKAAISLDGRSALPDGRSQWITGEAARTDGHGWRRRAGALLTGVGTVNADDPRLDVRLVPTARQPLRVIVDSRLQTPPQARILPPPGAVLLYAAADEPARRAALQARGAEIALQPGSGGKVDLQAMLQDLAARGINELHVEAGHQLNASLLATGWVDELLVYVAPKLLGEGAGLAALVPPATLDDVAPWRFVDVTPVGDDLRLRLRPPGRERF